MTKHDEGVEAAARVIAEDGMRYTWAGLRDGRCLPQYPPFKVGGHYNARKGDYADLATKTITAYHEALGLAPSMQDVGRAFAHDADCNFDVCSCHEKRMDRIVDVLQRYADRITALQARVAEVEGESALRFERMAFEADAHAKICVERDDMRQRAEAAEARVAELEGVLTAITCTVPGCSPDPRDIARAALKGD